jgi:hypothetical protein
MKHNKKIISTVGLILIALTGYHLLWGRLFPFSPIIIGFEQEELNSGTVYYGKGIDISKYKTIDSLIDKVEKFHRLQFKKKVKIFVMDSDKEFVRSRCMEESLYQIKPEKKSRKGKSMRMFI